mgnify:CR=1 FL=1
MKASDFERLQAVCYRYNVYPKVGRDVPGVMLVADGKVHPTPFRPFFPGGSVVRGEWWVLLDILCFGYAKALEYPLSEMADFIGSDYEDNYETALDWEKYRKYEAADTFLESVDGFYEAITKECRDIINARWKEVLS